MMMSEKPKLKTTLHLSTVADKSNYSQKKADIDFIAGKKYRFTVTEYSGRSCCYLNDCSNCMMIWGNQQPAGTILSYPQDVFIFFITFPAVGVVSELTMPENYSGLTLYTANNDTPVGEIACSATIIIEQLT